MSDPVIRQFAQLISNMAIENVPVAAKEQIRWRVLNAFATMLSKDMNQTRQATVPQAVAIGTRGNNTNNSVSGMASATQTLPKSSALFALLYGATLDIEPSDADRAAASRTVDAAIIPAAWALVQAHQGSGHLFMSALAAGYSATAVLTGLHGAGQSCAWQVAAVNGAVGAAAAAARANQLSAAATLDAMGFATAQAAQLAENAAMLAQAGTYDAADGVDQGQYDLPGPGRAATDGVLSAQMAALGGHCLPVMTDQLQQAMDSVNLNRALSEAWTAVALHQPIACDQAVRDFRQRVASVIGADETETIIQLVLRLEHTTPGELAACMDACIGIRLNSQVGS